MHDIPWFGQCEVTSKSVFKILSGETLHIFSIFSMIFLWIFFFLNVLEREEADCQIEFYIYLWNMPLSTRSVAFCFFPRRFPPRSGFGTCFQISTEVAYVRTAQAMAKWILFHCILILIVIVSFSQWSNDGNILSKFPIAHRGTNLVCMVCLQEEI